MADEIIIEMLRLVYVPLLCNTSQLHSKWTSNTNQADPPGIACLPGTFSESANLATLSSSDQTCRSPVEQKPCPCAVAIPLAFVLHGGEGMAALEVFSSRPMKMKKIPVEKGGTYQGGQASEDDERETSGGAAGASKGHARSERSLEGDT